MSALWPEKHTSPALTVYELVSLGRIPYQVMLIELDIQDRYIIDQSLELMELSDIEKRKIYELSNGEYQCVMIARALAQDTSILLLDEPTIHLDVSLFKIFELLSRLAYISKECVLIFTHEAELGLQYSDYIWWFHQNKLFADEPENLSYQTELLKKKSNGKIFFDPSLGGYVSKNSFFKEVSFKGRGEFAYWVKHFSVRNAIKIRPDAAIQIQVGKGEKIEIHHEKESSTLEGLSVLKECFQNFKEMLQ